MKIKAGSTNVSVYFYVVQDASGTSPGEPVTGLLFSDIETGGSASYARQGAARVDLTLITLGSASVAHSDGGFILVDDTNMPGLYRCDYPDAAFTTGVNQTFCQIVVAAAKNAIAAPILVDIDDNVDQTVDNNVLAAGATGFAAIDTVVDAILVDTGTTIPATIATAQADLDIITDSDGVILGAAGVDLVWDEPLTGGTHNVAGSSGKRLRQIDAAFEVHSGTAQAGAATTITLDTGADSTNNDIYRGDRCVIVGGLGTGEHGLIVSYVASTRVATMSETWIVTPDNTSEFILVPADVDMETWNHNKVTGDGDWAQVASDVAATLVDTGTTIPALIGTPATDISADIAAAKVDTAAILIDTNDLQTNQGNWLTATGFNTVVPPSVAQFDARTLLAASYFDPTTDAVANVTLCATTTTNTDMVAAAPSAASISTTVWAETTRALTDKANFTVNVLKVNGVTIIGAGTAGDLWRA